MKHNRETINGKLRAYNEGKCTLQQFVDEIEAFFKESQQLKENASVLIDTLDHPICKSECYHQGEVDAYKEILGEKPR